MSAPSVIQVLEGMIAHKFRPSMESDCWVMREEGQEEFVLKSGVQQFAVRLDLKPEKGGLDVAFPFLKTEVAGLTCKCDLIVFIHREERNGRPLVLLIEMKSLSSGDYLKQLLSAREFVLYLAGLMRVHSAMDFDFDIKGVLIKSRRSPAKGTTRQINLRFEPRSGLDVCECDRNRGLSVSDLKRAAESSTRASRTR